MRVCAGWGADPIAQGCRQRLRPGEHERCASCQDVYEETLRRPLIDPLSEEETSRFERRLKSTQAGVASVALSTYERAQGKDAAAASAIQERIDALRDRVRRLRFARCVAVMREWGVEIGGARVLGSIRIDQAEARTMRAILSATVARVGAPDDHHRQAYAALSAVAVADMDSDLVALPPGRAQWIIECASECADEASRLGTPAS